jgi:hypothetical protein
MVIRIDVHLVGENPTNTPYAPTLDSRMVPDHTSHVFRVGQPFIGPHEVETDPYTGKRS